MKINVHKFTNFDEIAKGYACKNHFVYSTHFGEIWIIFLISDRNLSAVLVGHDIQLEITAQNVW